MSLSITNDGATNIPTLAIIVGTAVPICLVLTIGGFLLHRRVVRQLAAEDLLMQHTTASDFGLEEPKEFKGDKSGTISPSLRQLHTKNSSRESMQFEIPYLLPPEVTHSRESFHSVAHSGEDDAYRIVADMHHSPQRLPSPASQFENLSNSDSISSERRELDGQIRYDSSVHLSKIDGLSVSPSGNFPPMPEAYLDVYSGPQATAVIYPFHEPDFSSCDPSVEIDIDQDVQPPLSREITIHSDNNHGMIGNVHAADECKKEWQGRYDPLPFPDSKLVQNKSSSMQHRVPRSESLPRHVVSQCQHDSRWGPFSQKTAMGPRDIRSLPASQSTVSLASRRSSSRKDENRSRNRGTMSVDLNCRTRTKSSRRQGLPLKPLQTFPLSPSKIDLNISAIAFAPRVKREMSSIQAEIAHGRHHSPLSPRNELRTMPSPSELHESATFSSLDFAPPKKFAHEDTNGDCRVQGIRYRRSSISRTGAGRLSRIGDEFFPTKEGLRKIHRTEWEKRSVGP